MALLKCQIQSFSIITELWKHDCCLISKYVHYPRKKPQPTSNHSPLPLQPGNYLPTLCFYRFDYPGLFIRETIQFASLLLWGFQG